MLEEILLRSFEQGDLDALVALDALCFDEAFRFSRSTMRRYAEAQNAKTVLAECGGRLLAFLILHLERTQQEYTAYLTTLDVHPAHRRRGLAHMLMVEAEAQALSSGSTSMVLHVFAGNEGAVMFYENERFNRMGIAKNFYGPGLDAYQYKKRLTRVAGPRVPKTLSTAAS